MTEEASQNEICKKCGRPLNKNKEDSVDEKLLCDRCGIELAEQYISEVTKAPKSRWANKRKFWAILRLIIILASMFIVALRTPRLISVIEEQKPIRNGTYATENKADKCIENLWKISRMLQEGRLAERDMVCPISRKPYVLRTVEGDTIVICPNPELHGLREIRVSKKYPRPKVVE